MNNIFNPFNPFTFKVSNMMKITRKMLPMCSLLVFTVLFACNTNGESNNKNTDGNKKLNETENAYQEEQMKEDIQVEEDKREQELPDEVGEAGDPHSYRITFFDGQTEEGTMEGQIENEIPFKEDITRSYTIYDEDDRIVHLQLSNE